MDKSLSLAKLNAPSMLSPPTTPSNSPCEENSSTLGHQSFSTRSSPSEASQNTIIPHTELSEPNQTSISSLELLHKQTVLLFNDDASKEFYHRTRQNHRLFRLSADSIKPIRSSYLVEIARAMTWWSLIGRMKLEALARDEYPKQNILAIKQQSFMDISKAFWIVQEALQIENGSLPLDELWFMQHSDTVSSRNFFMLCLDVLAHIQGSIRTMQRHGMLLEDTEDAILLQGVDTLIWVSYTSPRVDINYLLTGHHETEPKNDDNSCAIFPLGDNQKSFHYGEMLVDVFLVSEHSNNLQIKYNSILSILRMKGESSLTAVVGTQDGRLRFSITADEGPQPSWSGIVWLPRIHSFELRLRTSFRLHVRCTPLDFRRLSGIYEYHRRIREIFELRGNEALVFESKIKSTEYIRKEGQQMTFPTGPVSDCTLRLFEKVAVLVEGTGPRRIHKGFRLAVLTPLAWKNISIITENIPPDKLTQFGFLSVEAGNPVLSLKINNENVRSTLILGFSEPQERTTLLSHLTGCFLPHNEVVLTNTQVNRVSFATPPELSTPSHVLDSFQWQSVRVINQITEPSGAENSKTVLSESLRIIVDSPRGRITDRVNVGIGELKIRRNVVASGHELQVLREPRGDLTFALADPVDNETAEKVSIALKNIQTCSSIRTYNFPNLSELHSFQSAITGFSVLFDGTPTTFSISRRRMMVPMYKEWSSPHTRIQILKRGRLFQLAAFFEGFSRGKCMNFVLKDTEVFMKFKKNGTELIRIVDAKFTLPSGGKNDAGGYEAGFACLDFLEYPGEHDDITIGFESNTDHDKFVKALPHLVKEG